MTSTYLERPLRSLQGITSGLLANFSDTYIVVGRSRGGQHYLAETNLGWSRRNVVRYLAKGQYVSAVGVLRIARDFRAEVVTEDIARDVVAYLDDRDETHDGLGHLIPNDFLDEVRPEWGCEVGLGRLDPPEYERGDAA